MKKLLLIFLWTCLVSACQPQMPRQELTGQTDPQLQIPAIFISTASETPHVTVEEAKQHFDMQTAYFVDARSRSEYEEQHIAGAFYLPIVGLDEHLHELPNDKLVITYCT